MISTVAQIVVREPQGFDDFISDGRPLSDRFKEYFNDPAHPELETIIVAAWRKYCDAVVPRAYLKAIKIVLRQFFIYRRYLFELEPSFDDCPAPCKLAEDEGETFDLPDLCSRCEVRIQLNFFREATNKELARRFKDDRCAWSFESLYDDALHLLKVDDDLRGKGYPKRCDVLFARCLDLLRNEQQRPRRIDLWELKQRARSKDNG